MELVGNRPRPSQVQPDDAYQAVAGLVAVGQVHGSFDVAVGDELDLFAGYREAYTGRCRSHDRADAVPPVANVGHYQAARAVADAFNQPQGLTVYECSQPIGQPVRLCGCFKPARSWVVTSRARLYTPRAGNRPQTAHGVVHRQAQGQRRTTSHVAHLAAKTPPPAQAKRHVGDPEGVVTSLRGQIDVERPAVAVQQRPPQRFGFYEGALLSSESARGATSAEPSQHHRS